MRSLRHTIHVERYTITCQIKTWWSSLLLAIMWITIRAHYRKIVIEDYYGARISEKAQHQPEASASQCRKAIMNLYRTYGKGAALGSRCVIAAPTELRAKQIHYLETGYIAERVEFAQNEMDVLINGQPLTEYCFFIWNGNY